MNKNLSKFTHENSVDNLFEDELPLNVDMSPISSYKIQ